MTERRLLPAGPTTRLFRVPAKWLREEAIAGRVPHLRAGKAFLFDPKAVEQVLLERAQQWGQGDHPSKQEGDHQ
jgi:hypothetical protein